MDRRNGLALGFTLLCLTAALPDLSPPARAGQLVRQGGLDPAAIEKASGTPATRTADGVVRIGWARDDVSVEVDGMPLKPFAGLGCWAAFKEAPQGAMVMGDTVVFEDEVDAAMDAALAGGLEVTALHNHFFYAQPQVYFMHIGASGEAPDLAAAVAAVWKAIRQVRASRPNPATRFAGGVPQEGSLDTEQLQQTLGLQGQVRDGVLKVSLSGQARMGRVQVGASMGLSSWAAFSGSDALAAVDGDFIMTADQVQPLLKAMRREGIHVVALHNHMIGEAPTQYFVHYWGKGPALQLAQSIRAVLDAQTR
ncbi:MAG: DUF1259 domain-containing protein [Acidobacteriota bacterium]